jgi:hypothetical protein
VFSLVLALPQAGCPQGADYRATVAPVAGACAVAWSGDTLIVCAPDADDAGAASANAQLRAARIPADSATPAAPIATTPWAEVVALSTRVGFARDIALRPDGAIAVADLAGVVHVRATGAWSEVGRGTLRSPVGIVWSGDTILVSDARLRAVVAFGPDGVERGPRVGEDSLLEPAGLAIDEAGSLFVADRLGDCVWRFDRLGGETPAWSEGVRLGESGANPGQFSAPRDVAIVTRGERSCLLVADELNHRVQVVDRTGAPVGFFGMHALVPRQGEGRIHYPVGLAVSPDGSSIAVAEAFEDRVQVLALSEIPPEPDPALGTMSDVSSHFGAESAGRSDLLAVVDLETESVAIFVADRTPPIHIAIVGGVGALSQRFGEISALAFEPARPRLWIADRVRHRIDMVDVVRDPNEQLRIDQFIPRLAKSVDLRKLAERVATGGGAATMRTPEAVDIAFGSNGSGEPRVFVLDRENRSVLEFDPALARGAAIPLPAEARAPEELAVANGRIVVTDPVARALFDRDPSGAWRVVRSLGAIELLRPSGVAILDDGSLVVSDGARDACVVWREGSDARVVGARGGLDEQFFQPESISGTGKGMVVIDRGNHRFQRFAAVESNPFAWNMTGGLGRWYDRKRRGSPGAPPRLPANPPPAPPDGAASPANNAATSPSDAAATDEAPKEPS